MTELVELQCRTNYSFLTGASHPDELVNQAIKLGYHSLAITDECSLAGIVRAWQAVQDAQAQLNLIIGCQLVLAEQSYILLAKNFAGYQQLCRFISKARQLGEKGSYTWQLDQLSDLPNCALIWRPTAVSLAHWQQLNALHPECYLGISLLRTPGEQAHLQALQHFAHQQGATLVACNDVHYHHRSRQPLQDCLTAIRHRCSLFEARPYLFSNSERHLRSARTLAALYPESILQATTALAKSCQVDLTDVRRAYRYPGVALPKNMSDGDYLRHLVEQGAKIRFPEGIRSEHQALIEKELALISELEYEKYFLTVHDIVRYARSQGILCQGRGSAANSIVCYCLHITEVDPRRNNLLVERFMSRARKEPPDIDIDFDSKRREEVIQYIYRKYNRRHTAIAATVITYRRKSAIRDLAKVFDLDLNRLEQVISRYGMRYLGKDWLDQMLSDVGGLSQQNMALFKSLLVQLLGFPRHLSQHVGGFIISEQPLDELVPIENAAMPDRTVIEWDKDDLESIGLMKVDVLGLGMLGAIQKSFDLLGQIHGKPFVMQDIPANCELTWQMIQQANTVGVFQIESRAQMNMLPRLKPACFYDLVVQIAIVRPGPIHGDMVHPYLKRRQGLEPVDYPEEKLKPVLERTLGIPIFQEQLLHFAMVAADFSEAEANRLRKGMASWKRTGHMLPLREQLKEKLAAKGYDESYIARIDRQIEGFGEYGFPESHAASFALLAWASCWLKQHHPAIFTVALLNSQPMGFYTPYQLIQAAQHDGVEVRPVHINHSQWQSTIEADEGSTGGYAIRLGMQQVRGLHEARIEALLRQRPKQGWQSIDQLPAVMGDQLERLAAANALSGLGQHRHGDYWQTLAIGEHQDLLDQYLPSTHDAQLPQENRLQSLQQDLKSTGIAVNDHPASYLRSEHKFLAQLPTLDRLPSFAHKQAVKLFGLVTVRQRPGTAAGVTFVTIEDATGVANLVVWERTAHEYLAVLTQAKMLLVDGRVDRDPNSQVTHVIVERLQRIDNLLQIQVSSHDFH
ncbi:error-prone DNA polymerase [Salinibius halmophilus]|uniref:error-prone DNA polymerase n=1 Tax=Salinibius halmophilus TaxID=1853216 RepID=UPI000E664D56|nr:error-prone DNA polymerase [Salinibius halmophilus]